MQTKQKVLIAAVSVFIVFAVLIAMVPLAINMLGSGIKTDGIDRSALKPSSTEVDGEWTVSNRPGANRSAAGFTFNEVLPGERRETSGSTNSVSGRATVTEGTLTAGTITVDMTNITTDSDVRDNNVRRRILHTDTYPESTFELTSPADVSAVPTDGTTGTVTLTGDLTIHGETNAVEHTFEMARSGDNLIIAGDIPINRTDYGVETPELVAAKIDEEGEINMRLTLTK